MKKLDLSLAVNPNIGLFTAGTFDFLQLSYQEGFSSIMIQIIINMYGSYNTGITYILNGLVLTSGGGNYTITSGSVFLNGEIYQYLGGTFPISGGVPVANLQVSSFSDSLGGDPMTFTITGTSNVHNIRLINFVSGASGSGTFNGSANTGNDLSHMLYLTYPALFNDLTISGSIISFKKDLTIIYSAASTDTIVFALSLVGAFIGRKVRCIFFPDLSSAIPIVSLTETGATQIIEIVPITYPTMACAGAMVEYTFIGAGYVTKQVSIFN